tara:strand:- start:31 stop:588 length:558 start_codon:yes stop_codon:yes gene_type:complete
MNVEEIQEYIEEYLQDKKTNLKITNYTLKESASGATIVLRLLSSGDEIELTGTGVGLLDACWAALVAGFKDEYGSLNRIELTDAYFRTDVRKGSDVNSSMKSRMVINLEFKNQSKNIVSFRRRTSSVSYSSVSAVVAAIEFYINCEKLFNRLRFLTEEAKGRNRSDIAQKYCYALSKIVQVTNYT